MLLARRPHPFPKKPHAMVTMPLVHQLRAIVGKRHVLIGARTTLPFRRGYRAGAGPCAAAVRPGSLVELWKVLEACVEADAVVIIQAANTGLTGGSTPHPDGYDGEVIVINTLRIDGIRLLHGGRQVVCLAGATLHRLERTLAPLNREPHSVIGSSCFGASVVGGVCNNSGGALVRRGPAYTEMALYAQLGTDGRLRLANHLGLELGQTPADILSKLDDPDAALDALVAGERQGSDAGYQTHVRDVEASSPARFNADPKRLYEASGCAGKLAVFAVRLDSFEREEDTVTFHVGTREPAVLTRLRRAILGSSARLRISAEYLHGEAFDLAERYGKDLFLAIAWLGTDRLPQLNRWKEAADRFLSPFAPRGVSASDLLLHNLCRLMPRHLPRRLRNMRARFEHHLLLKVSEDDADAMRALLSQQLHGQGSEFITCTASDARKAFPHRFVIAGAATRCQALDRDVGDVIPLDIALPRDAETWFERLPAALAVSIRHRIYYGHFLCHVFHQDYTLVNGADATAVKDAMLALLDRRGAEYPAEHNVGHLYRAKPALAAHYRALDPMNRFNPGLGRLPRERAWRTPPVGGESEIP